MKKQQVEIRVSLKNDIPLQSEVPEVKKVKIEAAPVRRQAPELQYQAKP
jgi:hypothetical protein